jgi:uncharacterized protein YndB with AHSA1/START domain
MTADTQQRMATVTTPTDREIRIEREFDAPRDLVFATMLDPELVSQWWGPRSTTTKVDYMEPKTGGRWRFEVVDSDGNETAFRGAYREVNPPERIVQSWEWEGMPGHVAIETMELEDLGDRTRIVVTSLWHTTEERDGMLASGMEGGLNESYQRMDELLERLTAG